MPTSIYNIIISTNYINLAFVLHYIMITVVGAGPVGCYAASLLADKFKVVVFEEHSKIGLPVQCTGIVTQEIFSFIPKRNCFIINKVKDVRIFPPDNKFLKLSLQEPDLIIDRTRFDNYFYNLAKRKGVKFYLNHKFLSAKNGFIFVKDLKLGRVKKFKSSILIGADGPLSSVARASDLFSKRKFFIGVQAVVKRKNNNTIDFYPFKHGFGWAIPENKSTLRVGVASRTNPKEHFEKLLRKYKGKIIAKQGGLIPLFNPYANFCRKNIFLIGDAAGFVKATTGGGIIPGLKSAEILARSLKNNLSYKTGIYLHLFPSLWLHLKMRRLMDSFNQEEWNNFIKEMSKGNSKRVLQGVNRDQLFKLISKTALSNPRILKYGFRHLDHLV